MTQFKLHNQENGKDLVHPKVGLWNTSDRKLADNMCESFRAYLRTLGLGDHAQFIVVQEVEENSEDGSLI